jgi:hypothetical protein
MTTMTYAPPVTGFGSHGYGQEFGLPTQAPQAASHQWMAPQFAGGVPGGGALPGGVTPLHATGPFYGIANPYGIPQSGGFGQQFGAGTPFGAPTPVWLPQYLPQQQQYLQQQTPFGPASPSFSPWQALAAVAAYLQQVLQAGPYGQSQQSMPYGQGQQQFARAWQPTY